MARESTSNFTDRDFIAMNLSIKITNAVIAIYETGDATKRLR